MDEGGQQLHIDNFRSSRAKDETMKRRHDPSVVVVVSTVVVLVRGPPSVVPTAAASPVAGTRRPFVAVLGLLDVKATFSHFCLIRSSLVSLHYENE